MDPPRQLMAIHVRHVDVGEHGVPRLSAACPLLGGEADMTRPPLAY